MNTPMKFHTQGSQGLPVLVLGNSLASSTALWAAQIAVWRQQYQVLCFDYAGHGQASMDGVCTTVAELAESVLGGLDALGVDRFHYVGLSLGGMLGLQLAATAPTRVQKLVVANAKYFQTEADRQQWMDRIAKVALDGTESVADATVSRWLTAPFIASHPETAALLRGMIAGTSRQGYAAAAAMVRDIDFRPLLPSITCPSLLISGSHDMGAPAAHMAELAAAIKAQHLALSPCAHISNHECEAEFTAAVSAFLR